MNVPPSASASLALGSGYVLDTLSHKLSCGGTETQLSPLGSRLLQLMAERPGEVVERADIVEALWKGDWLVGDPALSRLVSELRSATGDDAKRPSLIQTVPRRGYRLVTRVGEHAPLDRVLAPAEANARWEKVWRLANRSLAIVVGGGVLILALGILARLAR